MRATVNFTECEHMGDLDNYLHDLCESGATIVDYDINEEAEAGHVTIEIMGTKKREFLTKFAATDSCCFSSLRYYAERMAA